MPYVQKRSTKAGKERHTGYYETGEHKVTTQHKRQPDGTTITVTVLKPVALSAGTYDTHDEAIKAATAAEKNLSLDFVIDPAERANTKVLSFAKIFLSKHRREINTMDGYETWLRLYIVPYLGKFKVSEVTPEMCQNFLNRLETRSEREGGPVNPPSLQKVRAVLSAMFGLASRTGYCAENPARGLYVPDFVVEDKFAWDVSLVNEFIPHLPNVPAQTYAKLQVATGARPEEMRAFRVSDFDFDGKRLTIARVVIRVNRRRNKIAHRLLELPRTKTKKSRRIDLGDSVLKMISDYITRYELGPNDLLFPARLIAPRLPRVAPLRSVDELQAECAKIEMKPTTSGIVYKHGEVNAYAYGGCRGPWCTYVFTRYSAERKAYRRTHAVEIAQEKVDKINSSLEAAREVVVKNLANLLKAKSESKTFWQTRLTNAQNKVKALEEKLNDAQAEHAAAVRQRKNPKAATVHDEDTPEMETTEYLSPETWTDIFNRALEASGIEHPIKAGSLRHTHALMLLMKLKWSGMRVAERLGHTKEVLLKHYVIFRAGPNADVVAELDELGIDFAA
ncbi:site-specific integrase [Streptosporangium sp. NPDC023825]|uniref:site-specific integrase n=1 Tax=Streptosporangium sp. NPDC023825 TaxID=3154909 RepID=UPI00342BEABC